MGNAASTTRKAPVVNQKLIVKPPVDWNANSEAQKFVVVSPQSDISNPSQIRHPHHRSKMRTMTTKTPMRKRTSKVVSKQVPSAMLNHNLATDLPEPASFYFDPSTTNEQSSNSDSQDLVVHKRGLHKTMKAKATRARQILKGCWKEQKAALEGCVREKDELGDHHRLQSMSPSYAKRVSMQSKPSQYVPQVGKIDGPQFIPEVEEEPNRASLSPRQVYLHDEDNYVKRIGAPNETPMMVRHINPQQEAYLQNSDSLVQNSPVAKLFDRRAYSEDMAQDDNAPQVDRHSFPGTAPKTKIVESDDTPREPNSVEKDIQRQVDEQIRLQFESKRDEIGRVKRLRENYLEKLEKTKRLSQEEAFRRKSIESKMEFMRSKVIAEEFKQQTVVEESNGAPIPFDEPTKQQKTSGKTAELEASNTHVEPVVSLGNENKEKPRRGRSSAPASRSTNAAKAETKPKRKSAPPQKTQTLSEQATSNKLPVLLKIAGWEKALASDKPQPVKTIAEPELPAILKLAGWKQTAKRGENPTETAIVPYQAKSTKERIHAAEDLESRTTNPGIDEIQFEDDDEGNHNVPLPRNIDTVSDNIPKETPVVQKMSRMLMVTQSFTPIDKSSSQINPYGALAYATNLDDSVDSASTPYSEASSRPTVAHDALVNAAFLFSPSYVDNDPSLLRLCQRKSEGGTTITTLDSRHRLVPDYSSRETALSVSSQTLSDRSSTSSMASTKPTIGAYSNPTISKLAQKSTKHLSSLASKSSDNSERHVRFSIDNHVMAPSAKPAAAYKKQDMVAKSPLRSDDIVVPLIEHKMSDLTDTFGSSRDSMVSTSTMERRESFVKATIERMNSGTEGDTPTAKENEEPVEEPSPPSNWSYNLDMDNGVTPLRSGRGGSISNKTNSPHKRFNEAKSRFSSGKVSPIKKKSPVKSRVVRGRATGGIVHARVAAMEQLSNETASVKVRRDTNAHKALAPRRAVLQSSHFKQQHSIPSSGEELQSHPVENATSKEPQTRQSVGSSTASSNRSLVFRKPSITTMKKYRESGMDFARAAVTSKVAPNSSDEESDTESDAFGEIRKSASIDDRDVKTANRVVEHLVRAHNRSSNVTNTSASTEAEEDDFAAILQFQNSGDDDEYSVGQDTVSTLQRRRLSNGSSTVVSGSTAPTVVRRSSIMSSATTSTVVRRSSMFGVPKTNVAKISQGIENAPRPSAGDRPSWSSYPPRNNLPFRETALVRPTEQNHRVTPGNPVLSPMQRTPMQALKWKTLAAQEKIKSGAGQNVGRLPLRKSDPNVVGH